MLARPFSGGGEAEQVVGVPGVEHDPVAQLGPPFGQGARLVEGERVDPRQPLQHRAPLDQDPAAGEPRRGRQDGRRGRQDQGAGARHHQHRQRRHRVECRGRPEPGPPPERPRVGRQQDQHRRGQDRRQEEPGVAVGRPLQRRPLRLRRAIRRITWPSVVSCPIFSARTSSRPNWLYVPV